MKIVVPAAAYFAALSRRLNSTCSNSTASSDTIGMSVARSSCTAWCRRILSGALQGRADDLRKVVRRELRRHRAGFELGHVEQIGDETIEPLGLIDDRRQKLGLFAVAQPVGEVAHGAGRAEHRGERRLQIVRNRGEQRRAQPLGLGRALDPLHVLDELHALDRERALIHQRVEEPPLLGREQRAGLVAVDADDADGAAAGMHRQEQPLGAGQAYRSRGRRRDRSRTTISPRRRSASSSVSSGG